MKVESMTDNKTISNPDIALSQTIAATQPVEACAIEDRTDAYFNRTKKIVQHYGDKEVIYAIFLRRPVISAPRLVIHWLENVAKKENIDLTYYLAHPEGEWVSAGQPILYLRGSFQQLTVLETILLQKLGACCVASANAYEMAKLLPNTGFIAMGARHCAGYEMQELMEYAVWVGSEAAKKEKGVKGFIGTASNLTGRFFGQQTGFGTMPHALIGYAGSTLRAAQMFHEQFPEQPLGVLVDYFGKEITDGLEVCRNFPELAAEGRITLRLDTHGARYLEGLDRQSSYAVILRHTPSTFQGYYSEKELVDLVGMGVSAAAIWRMREVLDESGFPNVKIIASSGFNVEKCKIIATTQAPVDFVGTGSFIPSIWAETYATADIVAYDRVPSIKKGREFLIDYAKKYVPELKDGD